MFDRIERREIPGQDLYGVIARMHHALSATGQIGLTQVTPTSWVGKSPEVGLGMVVKATVLAYPNPYGTTMDLKLEAELEDKGILFLYVSWLVCLPIAPFLFFYAYNDAKKRKAALFEAAWAAALAPALAPSPAWAALPR